MATSVDSVDSRNREDTCNAIRFAWYKAGLLTEPLGGTVSDYELEAFNAGRSSMAQEDKTIDELIEKLSFMIENKPAKWDSQHWYALPEAVMLIEKLRSR